MCQKLLNSMIILDCHQSKKDAGTRCIADQLIHQFAPSPMNKLIPASNKPQNLQTNHRRDPLLTKAVMY